LESLHQAIAQAPPEDLPRLLGELRELEAEAVQRLYREMQPVPESNSERLLDVTEAALRLNVSEDYLYHHWKDLPFARKLPFGLRFSESGLNAYIRANK
jgi:predicted DNA-binding transcriptional regulator AlpA